MARAGSRWQEVRVIRRASSGTAEPCSSAIMVPGDRQISPPARIPRAGVGWASARAR